MFQIGTKFQISECVIIADAGDETKSLSGLKILGIDTELEVDRTDCFRRNSTGSGNLLRARSNFLAVLIVQAKEHPNGFRIRTEKSRVVDRRGNV